MQRPTKLFKILALVAMDNDHIQIATTTINTFKIKIHSSATFIGKSEPLCIHAVIQSKAGARLGAGWVGKRQTHCPTSHLYCTDPGSNFQETI